MSHDIRHGIHPRSGRCHQVRQLNLHRFRRLIHLLFLRITELLRFHAHQHPTPQQRPPRPTTVIAALKVVLPMAQPRDSNELHGIVSTIPLSTSQSQNAPSPLSSTQDVAPQRPLHPLRPCSCICPDNSDPLTSSLSPQTDHWKLPPPPIIHSSMHSVQLRALSVENVRQLFQVTFPHVRDLTVHFTMLAPSPPTCPV